MEHPRFGRREGRLAMAVSVKLVPGNTLNPFGIMGAPIVKPTPKLVSGKAKRFRGVSMELNETGSKGVWNLV